jgi:hypothetical protein
MISSQSVWAHFEIHGCNIDCRDLSERSVQALGDAETMPCAVHPSPHWSACCPSCSSLRNPDRYFAVIAKGDGVLDWKEMTGHYPGASVKLLPQGDHALSDYEQHLDEIIDFLNLV